VPSPAAGPIWPDLSPGQKCPALREKGLRGSFPHAGILRLSRSLTMTTIHFWPVAPGRARYTSLPYWRIYLDASITMV
jgi:hypothetical protein